jgi:hypothetical protein
VFGPKFAQTLEPFDAELQDGEKSWRVKGLISRVGDGVGRTEADRQFVFVSLAKRDSTSRLNRKRPASQTFFAGQRPPHRVAAAVAWCQRGVADV